MFLRLFALAAIIATTVFTSPSAVRADDASEIAHLRAENARLMAQNTELREQNSRVTEICRGISSELQARTNELGLARQLIETLKKGQEKDDELLTATKQLIDSQNELLAALKGRNQQLERDTDAFTKFWEGVMIISRDDARLVDSMRQPPKGKNLEKGFLSLRWRLRVSLGQRKAACDILEEDLGLRKIKPEPSASPTKTAGR